MKIRTLGYALLVGAAAQIAGLAREPAPLLAADAPSRTLKIGLILSRSADRSETDASDYLRGADLALSETQRAGELFGQRIRIVRRRYEQRPELLAEARELIRTERVQVLIGGVDEASATALSRFSDSSGVLFLNVGATSDALRRTECHHNAFHIASSDAMVAAARAAAGSGAPAAGTSIELWHSSLERYGGSQLNDRYRSRFHKPMSSAGWAGWAALKIAWETSLRAQSTDPRALVALLENQQPQFDAHKGAPLTFRAWDHQLRQPLYAVSHGASEKVVAELPDVSRNPAVPMRDQLDRFGDDGRARSCFGAGAR